MRSICVMSACRLCFVVVNQTSRHHNDTSHTNCNGHRSTANRYHHVDYIRRPLCSFCVSSLTGNIRIILNLDLYKFRTLKKPRYGLCILKRVLIVSILDFPLWLIIISFISFYLSKPLFSSFLQFKENFVRGLSNAVSELF